MRKLFFLLLLLIFNGVVLSSCKSDKPPIAGAIKLRDSLPIMTSYGVSKLISDSGVIRYKIVAEEWSVYDRTSPTKQTFMKGLLLEKFNEKFHIEMYITADTAFWYSQSLWELRGRVSVWNENGTVFNSQLLYWDMNRHEFYSNKFSHLITPDREVTGYSFHSNDQMTQYEVNFSHAVFPLPETLPNDTTTKVSQQNTITPNKTTTNGKTSPPVVKINSKIHERQPLIPKRISDKTRESLPPGGHFK